MPEYLAPGVYVEEVSTGPRPIEGVSTSTAGMAGVTERGPQAPRLVTSWQEYVRWFGSWVDELDPAARFRYLPYAVRGFFDNGGQRLFVARVAAAASLRSSLELATDGDPAVARASGPGTWGNNVMIAVRPASAAEAFPDGPAGQWFRVIVAYFREGIPDPFIDPLDPDEFANKDRVEPDVLEDFDNLSPVSSDSNFGQTVINAGSRLIELDPLPSKPAEIPFTPLAEGTSEEPGLNDFLDPDTDPIDERKGLAGLEVIDEISMLSVPDEVELPDITNAVIDQCERLKDRFALVNGPLHQPDVAGLKPTRDTSYAGLYFPWVRVLAPHTPDGHLLVPPTGHVAGICARVDIERGVHKAPANEVIRGIITRDLDRTNRPLRYHLNKQQQDILNPRGVNVIRDFRHDRRGIRLWGARTMSSDGQWKYINVRRLFLFVEESIDEGTQWAVFEPNYEQTWSAIRLSITAFLDTVWRNGALAGTTQEEAFFVKCDRTTMTQHDLDNGRLICIIGIAPVKPAEFVIFRISQKTLEAQA